MIIFFYVYIIMELCFYWINLEREKKRRQHIEEEFKKYNIKNMRIEAVQGNAHREDRELACTQSHIKAMKAFLATNDPYAIICEDDLSFEYKKYWTHSLEEVINNAPPDWQIIQLGFIISEIGPEFYNSQTNYLPHLRHYWSTICYIVNREGAKKITEFTLDTRNRNLFVADCIIYSLAKTYTYKYPMFTCMDNNKSSIHVNHNTYDIKSKKLTNHFMKEQFGKKNHN
jgi:GR25 family glycosyltransferase involved in LPS biosynthesis